MLVSSFDNKISIGTHFNSTEYFTCHFVRMNLSRVLISMLNSEFMLYHINRQCIISLRNTSDILFAFYVVNRRAKIVKNLLLKLGFLC